MDIKSIAPEYRKWVQEISATTIGKKIQSLRDAFKVIISDILYTNKSDNTINSQIDNIRKRLLYLNLVYNTHSADWNLPTTVKAELDKLRSSMDLVNKYEARETLRSQKKRIDVLTYVSIIVLPLTLITGYFGMNFRSMGAPSKSIGILTLNRGQLFVFILFALSIVLSIVYLNRSYRID